MAGWSTETLKLTTKERHPLLQTVLQWFAKSKKNRREWLTKNRNESPVTTSYVRRRTRNGQEHADASEPSSLEEIRKYCRFEYSLE